MLRRKPILAALAGVLLVPAMAAAGVEKFKVDPVHSEVGFTVRHFVSKISGRFSQIEGDITVDPQDLTTLSITGKAQTASITTFNERRDGHLKSPDFFDAEKNPEITFVSKKVVKSGDKLKLTGDFTMHGVTKELTLDVEVLGFANDRAGLEATGKLNRKDYGVLWNKTLDGGSTVLSDDVDLLIRVEAVHPKEEAPKKEEAAKR